MPTERMEEVEVVCGRCNGSGKDPQIGSAGTNMMPVAAPCTTAYGGCGGSGRISAIVASGSLTSARLRLADAEVSRRQFSAKCAEDPESWPPDVIERYAELSDAVVSAYAVVISFGSAALRTVRGA